MNCNGSQHHLELLVRLLLINLYCCHIMQSVVRPAIEDYGCEVDHIPGGVLPYVNQFLILGSTSH